MKIAFVGKGGSGKTTLSALFCKYLNSKKLPVLAIDADINQHLGQALGFNEEIPAMGLEIDRIKDYLRGGNKIISSASVMIKTTTPGKGSKLVRFQEENPVYSYFQKKIDGIRFMATGPFSEEDLGIKCYHSKVGAVELLLNHLIDGEKEYVVVDMTAGSDSFASGMFTKFDVTLLVVEPTLKSISVYKQYQEYAKNHRVKIKVVGNKVENDDDVRFIQEQVGEDLVAWFIKSDFVKASEKGQILPLDQLEPENLETLGKLQGEVDKTKKDWQKFFDQAVEFHIKNAQSWANEEAGQKLENQVDEKFLNELANKLKGGEMNVA